MARSTPLILGASGRPVPNSEILKRLRQVDPLFNLRPPADGRDVWWVVREWGERDARREMIRKQEIAKEDAYDLFCEIPRDCPVEEVPNYLQRRAEAMGAEAPNVRELVRHIQRYNLAQSDRNAQEAIGATMDDYSVLAGRLFNNARVGAGSKSSASARR